MKHVSTAAVGLAALLALTACGSSSDGGSETSAASTPAVSDTVAWAGSVCQRADELKASVDAVGTSISVDPGADATALDQIKEQLAPQVEAVKGDVVDLAGALAEVPAGSDPAVAAAAESLTAARGSLETSADALKASAQTFQDAQGPANRLLALKDVVASFGTVKTDAEAFAAALKAVGTSTDAAVKDAFAQAPECSAYVA
jgi:hypothetical protein